MVQSEQVPKFMRKECTKTPAPGALAINAPVEVNCVHFDVRLADVSRLRPRCVLPETHVCDGLQLRVVAVVVVPAVR